MRQTRNPKRPFDPGISLREASAQELQLELLRRSDIEGLKGEKIVESLFQHRDLWLGVILDRLYVWERTPRHLPAMMMIKLRDLEDDFWNADTLYVLCRGRENLNELQEIAQKDWGGELRIHDDGEELSRSLGTSEEDYFILSVWWD
jgi:hypothetical protein